MTNTKYAEKIIVGFTILSCLLTTHMYAQEKKKIKIVLMGTIHLTPSNEDLYKNKSINLHTAKKQFEIQEVVNKIIAYNPNQVCLEYPMEYQYEMDSIFNAYKAGQYTLKDNERDLFGIQAVYKLGLKTPTCINYSFGSFDADTVNTFARQNNQEYILTGLKKESIDFINEIDENLTKLTLKNSLIQVNSKEALQKNLGIYTKYFSKVGLDSNYVGANLVADWYSTNIHIYTNILRIIKPTDKTILVIFGQGHVPVLKHLFSNNSDFEVIELKDILK